MSNSISPYVSRYCLSGFLSLLTTLVMFLTLFEMINTPKGQVIVVTPAPKPIFTNIDKPPPKEPKVFEKPEYSSGGRVPVIGPPVVTPTDPLHKLPPPDRPVIYTGYGGGVGSHIVMEGGLQTIIKVPPAYPVSAEARNIEGYVVVEYNVTETGSTSDIRIVESRPENIFNQSSIDAVARFKFRPRVENGKPVATHGLRDKFIYELKQP